MVSSVFSIPVQLSAGECKYLKKSSTGTLYRHHLETHLCIFFMRLLLKTFILVILVLALAFAFLNTESNAGSR